MVDPVRSAPHGIAAIRQHFGDPRDFTERAWRRRILTPVKLPGPVKTLSGGTIRSIWVHRAIKEEVESLFRMLVVFNEWRHVKTLGCYAYRKKRKLGKLSTHSWAVAFDINSRTNRMRSKGDINLDLVDSFEYRGWRWGGRWRRRDPMHFQFCTGY